MNIIPKEHIRDFIFAGNSAFTLTSKKTNVHYTYHIKQANNNNNTYFINFNDNNKDTYAGYVKRGQPPRPTANALKVGACKSSD